MEVIMPAPFSAERFYILSGRRPPETKNNSSEKEISRTLPEVNITGNKQNYEESVFNECGDEIYNVYESLCDAEEYYNSRLKDNPSASDSDRIETASRFAEAIGMSSVLDASLKNKKIEYQNDIILGIVEKASSGNISEQDLEYIKSSSQKILQESKEFQLHGQENLSRLGTFNKILEQESQIQGVEASKLQQLTPEGQEKLNNFIEQEFKNSQKQRRNMETANIKSPEYSAKLSEIRDSYDLQPAPSAQIDKKIMYNLMRETALNR